MRVRRAVLSVVTTETSMHVPSRMQSHALLPLGRKTVLQVMLEELIAAGAEEIILLVGPDNGQVLSYVEALRDGGLMTATDGNGKLNEKTSLSIECINHDLLDRPGAIMLEARSMVGDEPFMFATTDTPVYPSEAEGSLLRRMCEVFESTAGDGVVAAMDAKRSKLLRHTVIKSVGSARGSPHFVVSGFVHSASMPGNCRHLCLVPRYVLSPIVFDYLSEQDERDGTECLLAALGRLAVHRESLWAVKMRVDQRCFDLSSFLLYSRAFIYFSLQDAEVGVAVREYLEEFVR